MSIFNKCILDSYTPPTLSIREHKFIDLGTIHKNLKSRQTIKLSKDEMMNLIKNKDFWFYESDIELCDQLKTIPAIFNDGDFDNITDGYGISEYIGGHEKYLPSIEYLQYIIMNDTDVFMTVYDSYALYDLSKRNDLLKDKITGYSISRHIGDFDEGFEQSLPVYEFEIPANIKYTKFSIRKYKPNLMVSCFQDPVRMISVNLPYRFYSMQPLPPNIYNYDIDDKTHKFGSLNAEEFNQVLKDICENGITKPLFMRLNGEILSSNDEETNLILFIAKLLKLPSIPVNVYLSNEDIGKNHLIDAITADHNILYRNIDVIKNIFQPYIIIQRPTDTIDVKYVNQYIECLSNDHVVVRYCKVESINNLYMNEDNLDEETHKMHEELHKKVEDKINNEIDKQIEKLLGKV